MARLEPRARRRRPSAPSRPAGDWAIAREACDHGFLEKPRIAAIARFARGRLAAVVGDAVAVVVDGVPADLRRARVHRRVVVAAVLAPALTVAVLVVAGAVLRALDEALQ